MIDWSGVSGIAVLISGFQSFLISHLANLRSVKIVQKSGKSQGIFQLLMSGNPAKKDSIHINNGKRKQCYHKVENKNIATLWLMLLMKVIVNTLY